MVTFSDGHMAVYFGRDSDEARNNGTLDYGLSWTRADMIRDYKRE